MTTPGPWGPDVLGTDFEAATLALGPDDEGEVVATLIRRTDAPGRHRAVLYVHGFNDYFFQQDLAAHLTQAGYGFWALDLRKYGRSLRGHQTPNMCTDLAVYDEELDAAVAAMTADGVTSILIVAHSTGGLIAPLWAARRRNLPIEGLALNSPFLAIAQPAAVRAVLIPVAGVVARVDPRRPVPAGVSGLYGESLHASRRGEWDYDTDWKPIDSFPVRVGWLTAVARGQALAQAGLDLDVPVLVLCSTGSITPKVWTEELHHADSVLDAGSLARWSTALARTVTCVRVPEAMHEVFLSPVDARGAAYRALDSWLGSLAPAVP